MKNYYVQIEFGEINKQGLDDSKESICLNFTKFAKEETAEKIYSFINLKLRELT